MRLLITEDQLKKIIQQDIDEDYPSSWDVEHFKTLKSFNQRKEYCHKHLTFIKSGTGRMVFKIDDEKVLKLVKNKKGVAQNEVEISYSNYHDLIGLVANIFNSDPNYLWSEMELARKVTTSNFESIVGVTFKDYSNALRYHHDYAIMNGKNRLDKPNNMDEMWENDFVNQMFQFMVSYDLPVGDLTRTSSYGVVSRDGVDDIVMIDYGLSSDVYSSYYN